MNAVIICALKQFCDSKELIWVTDLKNEIPEIIIYLK